MYIYIYIYIHTFCWVFDAPGEEAADVVAPVGVCVGHLGLPALGDCAD